MKRITVTWMDGKQETYDCPDYLISDGLLYLRSSPSGLAGPEPRRIIPLRNVRIVTE